MKLKSFVILLFIFSSTFSFSQNLDNKDYYLDTNNNPITKKVFDQKCKTHVLKCQKYEGDSITAFKINQRYKFGKFESKDYQQIRQLLSLDSKQNIENNNVIVLRYQDTLIDYNKALSNMRSHYKDYHNDSTFLNKEYPKSKFKSSRKRYVKNKFKCIKKFEKKYDTKIVHVYKFGDETKATYGALNMFKDRGVIKRLFFKNNNEHYILVLRPSGEYFLIGGHLSDKDLGKLIKEKNWAEYKEQLNISLTKKQINGYGIFKKFTGYHKTHCF